MIWGYNICVTKMWSNDILQDIMDILFSSMGYGVQPPLPQMFPVPPLPQFTSLYEKTEQLVSPPPAAYDRYDEFDAILERFDFNLPALAP